MATTQPGNRIYQYKAENLIKSVNHGSVGVYGPDAEGLRVKRVANGLTRFLPRTTRSAFRKGRQAQPQRPTGCPMLRVIWLRLAFYATGARRLPNDSEIS